MLRGLRLVGFRKRAECGWQARDLNEQLGFSPTDRLLIINCDDFGSSHSANRAIERGMREGIARSASLMVPAPCADDAVSRRRDLDLGVHLTLTSEYPGYRWKSLTGAASLHDESGYFPQTAREVWARADLDEVESEWRAQIERALDWGVDITHLDSHMHVAELDHRFFEVFARLGREYRLPIRVRRKRYDAPYLRSPRAALSRLGVVTSDRFVSPEWGESARPSLLRHILSAAPGVTEFLVHPAEPSEELWAYDHDYADTRAADAECIMDDSFVPLLKQHGITLIGFKPLRDLMRRRLAEPQVTYGRSQSRLELAYPLVSLFEFRWNRPSAKPFRARSYANAGVPPRRAEPTRGE